MHFPHWISIELSKVKEESYKNLDWIALWKQTLPVLSPLCKSHLLANPQLDMAKNCWTQHASVDSEFTSWRNILANLLLSIALTNRHWGVLKVLEKGQIKPFGKKISFLAWKKNPEPFRARFENTMGNKFFVCFQIGAYPEVQNFIWKHFSHKVLYNLYSKKNGGF